MTEDKKWELGVTTEMIELLYLAQRFSDFTKSYGIVSRAARTKVIKCINSYVEEVQRDVYTPVTLTTSDYTDSGIVDTILDNRITAVQEQALDKFKEICEHVLNTYECDRITVTHFVNLIFDEVAASADTLFKALIHNRTLNRSVNAK